MSGGFLVFRGESTVFQEKMKLTFEKKKIFFIADSFLKRFKTLGSTFVSKIFFTKFFLRDASIE